MRLNKINYGRNRALNRKLRKYKLGLRIVLIITSLFVYKCSSAHAAVDSDYSRFEAKDKAITLKIINYKNTLEEDRKRKEREKERKEKARRLKLLKAQQLQQQKKQSQSRREEIAKRVAETERLRKLAELKKKRQENKIKNRVANYKLIIFDEEDRIDFAKNRGALISYSELGTPEDITSHAVNRDEIASTDMYVRLLTETNINSRRGGEYVAVVEKDVFSLDSKNLLIPKGSKFICNFEPLQAYGETALNSQCNRVYFPNGRSMLITASVSDVMGRAGIVGELDNRMWEKYGQTFILSALSGLAMLGADKIPNSDIGSLAQYTALNTIDLSTKFLEKTIDLSPVVTIASGTRIIVKLQTDINLKQIKEVKTTKKEEVK